MRICKTCKRTDLDVRFAPKARYECCSCSSEKQRVYYYQNLEKERARDREAYRSKCADQTCIKCKVVKKTANFLGKCLVCKDCQKIVNGNKKVVLPKRVTFSTVITDSAKPPIVTYSKPKAAVLFNHQKDKRKGWDIIMDGVRKSVIIAEKK